MWRIFESAFVRRCAYILAGALLAFLMGHRAYADTTCFVWVMTGDQCGDSGINDPVAAANAAGACQVTVANQNYYSYSYSGASAGSCSALPTAAGQSCAATYVFNNPYGGFSQSENVAMTSAPGACPPPPARCTSVAGAYQLSFGTSSALAPGTAACGSDNCNYVVGPASTFRSVIAVAAGGSLTSQSATTDGSTCTSSTIAAPPAGSQLDVGKSVDICESSAGNVACVTQNPSGQYCGSYNGDYICLGQIPNNQCVQFSSGGAACTVATSAQRAPGGPDNGQAGQAAIPAAELVAPSGAVTEYFTAAQVAGSTVGVQTSGTGVSGTKNGATGTGSAVGSGSSSSGSGAAGSGDGQCVPSAQNQCGDSVSGGQDCVTPPVCTGDAVTCAIVNQSWLDRCAQTDAGQVASAVALGSGESVAAVTSDQQGVLSESGYVSGGATSCPSPPTVTVLGHSMTFDFLSFICEFASRIGPVVLVVAYLMAARIWIGALLQ